MGEQKKDMIELMALATSARQLQDKANDPNQPDLTSEESRRLQLLNQQLGQKSR